MTGVGEAGGLEAAIGFYLCFIGEVVDYVAPGIIGEYINSGAGHLLVGFGGVVGSA